MSLSGKARREKGAKAEREVMRVIRATGWPRAERSSSGREQAGVSDVRNGPAGVAIEIKRQEALNVPKAFRQLDRDAGDEIPVLVHRPSQQPWMATLPLEELLPLLALRERG